MPGLFSIFNTAKTGLFAQQTAINVTSHNVANANTDGYSRQRADMVTTTPYTMPSMEGFAGAGQLGTGVSVESIERIRDSFLDYQFRTQNAISGQYTAQDNILSQVEDIFNEPSDTSTSSLISSFFTSWQNLSTSSQNASTVAQQAYQLTSDLNNTYTQITKLKSDTNTQVKTTIGTINGYLQQLNQLNKQIQNVNIAGQNPNDLMDSRDLLLDKLSNEFGINITSTANDGINVTVDDDGSVPKGTDGNPLNIVQAIDPTASDVATLSYVNDISRAVNDDGSLKDSIGTDENGNAIYQYSVTYYKEGDSVTTGSAVTITVNMTQAQERELDENRVLWADNNGVAYSTDSTGKIINSDGTGEGDLTDGQTVDFANLAVFRSASGELKGYNSVQSNVDDYQDQLNKFAKALALSVNAIISQSSTFVPDNPTDGSAEGGINNFFVNGDQKDSSKYSVTDENNITAANITVNEAILEDASKIKVATKYDSEGNPIGTSTDGNRAAAVAQLADSLMNINNVDTTADTNDSASDARDDRNSLLGNIFTTNDDLNNVYSVGKASGGSTLDNFYDDTINRVGNDEQKSKNMVDYETTQLSNFSQSRESISGVSMDEEMTNLIQFQHCYQANAKMISTVDDLLDVVINGLKK